jgi:hypothetical protein
MTMLASGLLALFSGTLLLLWVGNYSTVVIMTYGAHTDSALSQTQAAVNVFSVTSEITLRQLLPGAACLSANAAVCAMAAQALQLGNMSSMLPTISAAAFIPALTAAFICWKLTAIITTAGTDLARGQNPM